MIGFITLGTNDVERAGAFYDALLSEIGAKRTSDAANFIQWEAASGEAALAVITPFDGSPATRGNGTMIGPAVDSHATVVALHAKALELGAADEGPPGPRGSGGFYGGYFRDLDGNKLVFFAMS